MRVGLFVHLPFHQPVLGPVHDVVDPAYVAGSILWARRDAGSEVDKAEELPAAVAHALTGPDAHAERRRHYARTLFGSFTDGRNHARVAGQVLELGDAMATGDVTPVELAPARAPVRLWHDLRSRLGVSRGLRRVLFPPIEACRLWRRGLTVRPAAPVEPLTRGGPGDG